MEDHHKVPLKVDTHTCRQIHIQERWIMVPAERTLLRGRQPGGIRDDAVQTRNRKSDCEKGFPYPSSIHAHSVTKR